MCVNRPKSEATVFCDLTDEYMAHVQYGDNALVDLKLESAPVYETLNNMWFKKSLLTETIITALVNDLCTIK